MLVYNGWGTPVFPWTSAKQCNFRANSLKSLMSSLDFRGFGVGTNLIPLIRTRNSEGVKVHLDRFLTCLLSEAEVGKRCLR